MAIKNPQNKAVFMPFIGNLNTFFASFVILRHTKNRNYLWTEAFNG